jgi:hypothetical protein
VRLVVGVSEPWVAAAVGEAEALAFERVDISARLHTTFLQDRFATASATNEDVEVLSETPGRSALRWPVVVVDRVIKRNGVARREVEVRYALFEFHASVVIRGPTDMILRDRDELLATALSARPDWSGDVACIADLLPELT